MTAVAVSTLQEGQPPDRGNTQVVLADGRPVCGARTRPGAKFPECRQAPGWGTDHPGAGRCKLHGGKTPVKHGRYSKLKRENLRDLYLEHAADPDPLNLLDDLALARGLLTDFIDRYGENRDALLAWYEARRDRQAQPQPAPREGEIPPEVPANPTEPPIPRQILDIGDAYRILSEVTRIVERIERIRAAGAISAADFLRFTGQMGLIVERHVSDADVIDKIREGWQGIRLVGRGT